MRPNKHDNVHLCHAKAFQFPTLPKFIQIPANSAPFKRLRLVHGPKLEPPHAVWKQPESNSSRMLQIYLSISPCDRVMPPMALSLLTRRRKEGSECSRAIKCVHRRNFGADKERGVRALFCCTISWC